VAWAAWISDPPIAVKQHKEPRRKVGFFFGVACGADLLLRRSRRRGCAIAAWICEPTFAVARTKNPAGKRGFFVSMRVAARANAD
jgi:hypothetical protein